MLFQLLKLCCVVDANYFTDKRLLFIELILNADSGAEQSLRFGEFAFVFGEHGADWIARFDFRAKLNVEIYAGIRVDRFVFPFAARAQPLNGPSYVRTVHRGENSAVLSDEISFCAGFVDAHRILNHADVASLGENHGVKGSVSGAAYEQVLRQITTGLGCVGFAAEIDHPAGQR